MLCSYFLLSEKTWGRDSYIKAPFSHTFAGTDAKLCVSGCKALHWQLQCFALAVAKLCVGSCNALRWQLQSFASETGKTGIEIVSPILDNRKGKNDSPYGPL